MPQEKSVGAIIYNKGKYLLLHYNAGHWGFPKGQIEKGETKIQTIRREVEEETGIKGIFQVRDFEENISYFFKRNGKTTHKEVTYYLFETQINEVKLSNEHTDFKWLSYPEAISLLTFTNTKNILRKTQEYLQKFK